MTTTNQEATVPVPAITVIACPMCNAPAGPATNTKDCGALAVHDAHRWADRTHTWSDPRASHWCPGRGVPPCVLCSGKGVVTAADIEAYDAHVREVLDAPIPFTLTD